MCQICFSLTKKHLQAVMKGWYEHVVAPKHAEIKQFLERDIQAKIKMQAQLSTEELVQWATNGYTLSSNLDNLSANVYVSFFCHIMVC